jgi:hypothetical protein
MLFTRYLQSRSGEEGRVGDLARMALVDPTWPDASAGRDRIAGYLRRRGADPKALEALAEAWNAYKLARREAHHG